jgi:hypothetical protein
MPTQESVQPKVGALAETANPCMKWRVIFHSLFPIVGITRICLEAICRAAGSHCRKTATLVNLLEGGNQRDDELPWFVLWLSLDRFGLFFLHRIHSFFAASDFNSY